MSHIMMWTLFLLLLLHLTSISQTYDFLKRHMDYPKTTVPGSANLYCDIMMQPIKLVKNGTCRVYNTFIHKSIPYVERLCYNPPEPCKTRHRQKCHESPDLLSVTDCFITKDNQPPDCQYRTKFIYRKIRVICKNDRLFRLDE